MVEGRDFVDLGEREAHLLRERREVRCRKMPVAVVDLVEVFDQQVALAGFVAQQRLHLGQCLGVDGAAFGDRAGFSHAKSYYRSMGQRVFLTAVKLEGRVDFTR